METVATLGNAVADLPAWAKVVVIVVAAGLLLVCVLYLWGLKSPAIDKVVKADLPRSRDPRKWLVYLSERGPVVKTLATALLLLALTLLIIPLYFSEVGAVAKALGRNVPPSVSPQLFVQHNENFSYLYLTEGADKTASQVEDSLTFQNISSAPLTHFRILVFAYTDFTNPTKFFSTYSVDTGRDYVSLGVFNVGSLAVQEEYFLSLQEIYKRFASTVNINQGLLDAFLFPKIGDMHPCAINRPYTDSHEAFTDNVDVLRRFHILRPGIRGEGLDAICGLPLKIEANYRSGTDQFSLLFMGGTFYYGRGIEGGLIPHPVAVASFVKPRWSLVRAQSGSTAEVINMDLEISGRRSAPPNPSLIAYSSVSQPDGEEQLDQLLSFMVNIATQTNLLAEARRHAERRNVEIAIDALDRLINLSPQHEQALLLRAEIREQAER